MNFSLIKWHSSPFTSLINTFPRDLNLRSLIIGSVWTFNVSAALLDAPSLTPYRSSLSFGSPLTKSFNTSSRLFNLFNPFGDEVKSRQILGLDVALTFSWVLIRQYRHFPQNDQKQDILTGWICYDIRYLEELMKACHSLCAFSMFYCKDMQKKVKKQVL